jgi:hypothetical protein
MAGGNENVTPLEFSRVSLSHRVGESLVVVDEEIEVVIHELERAVNNVPEQHGAMDPVGDHDDTAPWRVSRRKSHIDPRQQCAVDLPGLDLIEYRCEFFCHRDRPVDASGEEVLVGSRQKMIEVCRRASNRGVREAGGAPGRRPADVVEVQVGEDQVGDLLEIDPEGSQGSG